MSTYLRLASVSLIALAAGLFAAPAHAVDGVIEINMAKAAVGGVTAADVPGFPVEIGTPGSYVLTGDLFPPAGLSGISILPGADQVTIDLNGFMIDGGGVCVGAGAAIVCPPGLGSGIVAAAGTRETVVVNGSVRGFPDVGIDLGTHCRVENVIVTENTLAGLDLDDACLSIRNTADRNGGIGIDMVGSCKVENCIATGNGSTGIETLDGCTVLANTVAANGSGGIAVGVGNTIGDNTATANELFGIGGGGENRVIGNTVELTIVPLPGDGIIMGDGSTVNDNMATGNIGSGIVCGMGCQISGNNASLNGVDGIFASEGSGINHNTTFDNTDDGIHCDSPVFMIGCGVTGNTSMINTMFGLNLTPALFPPPPGIYRNNTFVGNIVLDVSLPGLDPAVFDNTCSGAIPCP